MIPDRTPAATLATGRVVLTERARAKVNLTLRIIGRRPDGYHELESLVAFAEVGDELTLDLAALVGLTVSGPFAAALAGHDNLALRALQRAHEAEPRLRLGALHLEKRLPVAAGIGGGSADAAAALRLVRAANPELAASVDWMGLASRLGADVAVCVVDRLSVMAGVGERVTPLAPRTPLPALLVNPMCDVPAKKTAAVFKALAAPAIAGPPPPVTDWPCHAGAFLAALAGSGNDLELPARVVMPGVTTVLEALWSCAGVRLARLSGAGPTCFALFDTTTAASQACHDLGRRYPGWWVAATQLS